jgi:alkylhydroperoxidase/carboxymuconolactone decarboxylase family protein YurZ
MMVGITVAQRCEYCLWKHVPEAVKLEANLEDNFGGCEYCYIDS